MHKKQLIKMISLASTLVFLTGCGETSNAQLAELSRSTYTKDEYETVTVQKGDMQPEFQIGLTQGALVYYNYSVEGEDLELDKINVSVGDYVRAGQVLVSFKSEELEKKVKELEDNLEQNKLLLEHVKKQKDINVDANNTTDETNNLLRESYDNKIKLLEDDITLSEIYLSEGRRKLDQCRVTAKDDGTISFVSNAIINGVVVPGSDIITEVSGEVSFYAEVRENYEFKVGDIFLAESPKMECEVEVTDIEERDTGSQMVYFSPISADVVYVSGEKFVINIKKENLKDVVYVDEKAIYSDEKKGVKYVYTVNEDGYREVRFVEVETIANNMAIISKGLEGGEEVTLK